MKKIISITFIFSIIILLVGCGPYGSKAKLLDWLHSVSHDDIEAYFWRNNAEHLLSSNDLQSRMIIFNDIKIEDLTENKELAGITPEYGLRLIVNEQDYHINQADAPGGQSEISFRNKQWWIENTELYDFMRNFFEN